MKFAGERFGQKVGRHVVRHAVLKLYDPLLANISDAVKFDVSWTLMVRTEVSVVRNLAIGWLGFNGGSALGINIPTVSALVSTNLAVCSGGLARCFLEY